MLLSLPKIALIICFLLFVLIIVKVLFFTRKDEVKHLSELPLEEDENKSGEDQK